MNKKEIIQIRVTEEEKDKLKSKSMEKGMTISEFLLYGAMRTINEDEAVKVHCKYSGEICRNI